MTNFQRWPMLILPIREHERSFHPLIPSPISFLKDLKFLYRSCTCLDVAGYGGCTPLTSAFQRQEEAEARQREAEKQVSEAGS